MKNINEEFLHFLWKNQQLVGIDLHSEQGKKVEVLDPGIHNTDAGPDFFNARVKIEGTTWAGNVELHVNASDWMKHGHPEDPAYDSVILHVIYFNDCEIRRKNGAIIPAVIIRFPVILWESFEKLQKNREWIACQESLRLINPVYVAQWTSSMMVERLEQSFSYFSRQSEDLKTHWDAILLRSIFRSFGLPVNKTSFEILGHQVPYSLLLRNKDSLFSLEAILFGQAGFLEFLVPNDQYMQNLSREFQRFSGKLGVSRVPLQSWKFMRMRPGSFPTLRIALLASFINHRLPFHEYLLGRPDLKELREALAVRAGDYWSNHYRFGKVTNQQMKTTGEQLINTVIINSISPYLFFYGKIKKQDKIRDYALSIFEELPAENNAIIKKWGTFGIKCFNAFDSQALLFLYKNYCKQKRCLECQFGNILILNDTQEK